MSSSIVAGFFSLENLENYFFTAPRKDERAPPHPTPPQSAHIFGTWTKTCVHEKVPTPPPPILPVTNQVSPRHARVGVLQNKLLYWQCSAQLQGVFSDSWWLCTGKFPLREMDPCGKCRQSEGHSNGIDSRFPLVCESPSGSLTQEQEQSQKCLERHFYDPVETEKRCSLHFENVNNCKKFWVRMLS